MNLKPADSSVRSNRRESGWRPLIPIPPKSASAGSRSRPLGRARVSGGFISPGSSDLAAEGAELGFEALVPAIQVIDAGDLGGAARGESREDEGSRGSEVGGHDGRPLIRGDATHDG